MADEVVQPVTQRYALITGANKGIGFGICRLLASKGIVVILASRDEKRGIEAQQKLIKEFDGNVVFHQLDVADAASIAAAFEFIKSRFGRLDILVNNAGIRGLDVDGDVSILEEHLEAEDASFATGGMAEPFHPKGNGRLVETFEWAKECIETNYYGAKRVTEALIPLLQLSDSPRIVNVSSALGSLVLQPNEWAKGVFSSKDSLTEERIDEVVQGFLNNFKEGKLQENHWPHHLAAYKVSKAALNAYTWLAAKKHPRFLINAVCPGLVRTDITFNAGSLSEVEGAEAPVKLALLPDGGPSESFQVSMEEAAAIAGTQRYALVTGGNKGIGFEICRQLASKGIVVILTSRDEKRGFEAVEKLKEFGLSNYVVFHQLDVVIAATISAAVHFITTKFGRLDILVNNAGTSGIGLEGDVTIIQELVEADVAAVLANGEAEPLQLKANASLIQTYEGEVECIETNFYGAKRVTEAFIPLLQLSDSPRIVNISSLLGHTKGGLMEERIDEVVQEFLNNFKEGRLEENKWPAHVGAYKVSKAALIAYTKVLAKKHTDLCINSICPGFARTDITCNLGPLSAEEAAENVVRLALLPRGGASGAFFYMKDVFTS